MKRFTTVLFLLPLAFGDGVSAGEQDSEWTKLNDEVSSLIQKQRYDDAIIVAKKALDVAERAEGPAHPDVARCLSALADLYLGKGQYDQAEPLFKRALTIRENALGKDHLDVAESLNSLGMLYYKQARYSRAEPLYKRAMEIWEKALGADHPVVAASLNSLAELYRTQGRYGLAEPLYKQLTQGELSMHKHIARGLVVLAALGLFGPGLCAERIKGSGDSELTVYVDGQRRSCVLHLPPTYDDQRSLPVVIALHGSRGTGQGMAKMTGFSDLADQHGFIAVYPNGTVEPRSWNSLFGTVPGGKGVLGDDINDVAFIRTLIDKLRDSYRADAKRIFVCGHSSGAYMSYRLAVELSDRIAAVGIVNGSLGIKSVDGKPVAAKIPQPIAPISLIHICGAKDKAVKFDGAQTPKNLFKSVPDCIAVFVKADGCTATAKETRDSGHGVVRTRYAGGKGGTEVELVVVKNCGHEWSGAVQGLSASQALWDFYSTHPRATSGAAHE